MDPFFIFWRYDNIALNQLITVNRLQKGRALFEVFRRRDRENTIPITLM